MENNKHRDPVSAIKSICICRIFLDHTNCPHNQEHRYQDNYKRTLLVHVYMPAYL